MRIKCPICGELTTFEENPWRPFCSERCKMVDLGKWVTEEYKIDGSEDESEEGKVNSDGAKSGNGGP